MARIASAIAILLIAPLLTFASAVAEAAEADGVTIFPTADGPFMWGEPMDLEGTVTENGAPVVGASVELAQINPSAASLATVVTDATGRWTYRFTPPVASRYTLQASYVGATGTYESWTNFTVSRHPTTFTFSNNGLRQTDEQISFDVLLSADGAGLADRVVHWDLQCWYSETSPVSVGRITDSTTSAAGTFTVTYDQQFPCPEYALIAWWDGDQDYQPVKSWAREPTAWHRSDLKIHAPASAFVNDDLDTSVTVLVDGVPAPNRTVHIRYFAPSAGPTYLDVVSGPDGVAVIPIKAAEPGNWNIYATMDATDDTMAAERSVTVPVSRVATDLSVSPLVSAVLVGKPVTIRGSLARADGRNEGVAVVVQATESGVEHRYQTTTGSDGAFEFVHTPNVAGSIIYDVWVPGDDRYSYTSHPAQTVTVQPQTPAVTLTANKTSYSAGETATFRVNLTKSDSRRVRVTAQEAGGSAKVLYDGNVPSTGLTLNRTMWRNSTIVASHPADSRSTAAKATLKRSVRLGLATKALNPLRRVGAYAVYRPSADPTLVTSVRPVRSGLCVRMTVQRYRDAAWRTVATTTCRATDRYGKARWTFNRSHASGARFRIAARFAGDATNAAGIGPWTYIRFR
ncbi:carboxypeptidase regulatory-like domain-containing protein [Nocardioides sp. NPDC057577]|uniref:carboxypeptidase regulatory-like domain-containing protein n=1 Tax=Nocardioides sp. NPDC057577 TaxID=3346171 RepID=UPI00367089AE